jgi:hypothetical protein
MHCQQTPIASLLLPSRSKNRVSQGSQGPIAPLACNDCFAGRGGATSFTGSQAASVSCADAQYTATRFGL